MTTQSNLKIGDRVTYMPSGDDPRGTVVLVELTRIQVRWDNGVTKWYSVGHIVLVA